ncbi:MULTISPECIES: fumarylacetoacetate hydrolase family protein [Acidiplasma]|uniref:Fumarylacetoacetase n=2 Tax=Acidiplasma TaxID=507753 RepID=A0A0Q1B5D3_9ARCH|nr:MULTISPECIES: fumarylacetoacetate hydrolase family protein [Acidiplasma]KPV47468.1 fumarylacetoacetase [Acidiplasma aeolicum]KQB35240.1 fumarylacetoacetase [Acidiplasma cupricumulans]KQB36207.1 fumarylacetoacetase [Acidiplasma aeolicum]WMT55353.1 MAG: fumarylacetoacetate hydrolase family protein [Acidiplasma sp.]
MKIFRAKINNEDKICIYNNKIYDLSILLNESTEYIENNFFELYDKILKLKPDDDSSVHGNIEYKIPVPYIRSVRDFYSFEGHVKNARKNKGLNMIDEWYKFPVFYFSCTPNIYPSDCDIKYPEKSKMFDYEMEVAAVIGRRTINCHGSECIKSVYGFMIMNDWSLRDIQREEMKVLLGPAKGKDYATSFGRYFVTSDEILSKRDKNNKINLKMETYVNDKLYSSGNLNEIYFSFCDMIERASEDVPLLPGDIIGSGTFNTGCILELGTEYLRKGDTVTMRSDDLGILTNRVV